MRKFKKEKACAFSGNRILGIDYDKNLLFQTIENSIKKGYKYFLCGMAIGFDLQCFSVLLEFKKKHKIKIIACVPCKNQSSAFSCEDKILYDEYISLSDSVVVLSEFYYNGCMQARNRYMVDNSSLLISYNRKSSGGTLYTEKYAEKNGITVIKL